MPIYPKFLPSFVIGLVYPFIKILIPQFAKDNSQPLLEHTNIAGLDSFALWILRKGVFWSPWLQFLLSGRSRRFRTLFLFIFIPWILVQWEYILENIAAEFWFKSYWREKWILLLGGRIIWNNVIHFTLWLADGYLTVSGITRYPISKYLAESTAHDCRLTIHGRL